MKFFLFFFPFSERVLLSFPSLHMVLSAAAHKTVRLSMLKLVFFLSFFPSLSIHVQTTHVFVFVSAAHALEATRVNLRALHPASVAEQAAAPGLTVRLWYDRSRRGQVSCQLAHVFWEVEEEEKRLIFLKRFFVLIDNE